jgi:hypothetical protein
MNANKVALGVVDVFYGDQRRIPRVPTVCVDPGQKNVEIVGAPRLVQNVFTIYIVLYHSQIVDNQINHKASDVLAQAVEDVIHADPTLTGLVAHSIVSSNESGYMNKDEGRTWFRGARLTITANSRTRLPMVPNYNQ